MDNTFFDLKELFQQSGCPLCAMKTSFEERYLDNLFYENVNDPGVRDQLRDQNGFCPEHIQLIFKTRPSVLGISIIYDDLFRHYFTSDKLELGEKECPLCAAWEEKERFIKTTLVKRWHDLKPAWGDRTFLCPVHLKRYAEESAVYQEIYSLSRKNLERIGADLSAFIKKFDYRVKKDTITVDESNSWQEVLEFFASRRMRNNRTHRPA